MKTKAGFVALIGKPNAGKSTLLNTLLNAHLALVSHKANATRKLMKCIVPFKDKEGYESQIIFLDTPGLHHQEKLLNQCMLSQALKAMSDAELCVFLASVHDDLKGYEEFLSLCQKPHILALSKIDTATHKQVLQKLQEYQKYASQFLDLVPLSAKKSQNLNALLECISKHLSPSAWLFEKDLMSDEKMRDIYKEIIRESLFDFLSDEIPYESDVMIDKFIEEERIDKVYAHIIVEKESQKKIVIGKNGVNIKRIGTNARLKMQEVGEKKVFLNLQVIAQKSWSKEEKSLQKTGLHPSKEKGLKKILSALLMGFVGLNASDRLLEIMRLYQKQGLEVVGQKLDSYLADKSFWAEELQNKDTDFGYYQNKQFLFVADKSKPSLEFYEIENNMLKKINSSKALVGSKKGDKTLEGDLATPIGVYRITQKLERLDQYYGVLAFVTNYPNLYDTLKKRTGHGIWVHGMPLNGDRNELNTKGCIAIANPILSSYDKVLKGEKAFLITYEDKFSPSTKEELSMILSSLFQWKEAWARGDFERYMRFYNPNFTRYDGMSFNAFKEYKKRVFAKNEKKNIAFSSINVIPYPNSQNKRLFYVVFDQNYKAYQQNKLSYSSNSQKELYVEIENNQASIIMEK